MTSDPLFQQGLSLMMYGMGTVAVFLSVLVVLTVLMSKILTRCFPEPDKTSGSAASKAHGDIDPHIVAVIQTAIDKHRLRR